MTNTTDISIKTVLDFATQFCRHDDKQGDYIATAISLGIVMADGSEPNAEAVEGFRAGCAAYYAKYLFKSVRYDLISETDGKIIVNDKGRHELTLAYATSVTPSDLAKLKGERGALDTLKGQVCKARDAVSVYVANKYKRLANRALTDRGPKAAPREFWTFFDDEMNKVAKRAKKEQLCSDAEFKQAMNVFRNAIKGNK